MESSIPLQTGFSQTLDNKPRQQYNHLGGSSAVMGSSPVQNYNGVRGSGSLPGANSHHDYGSVVSSSQGHGRNDGNNSPKQSQLQSIVERIVSSFPISQTESG